MRTREKIALARKIVAAALHPEVQAGARRTAIGAWAVIFGVAWVIAVMIGIGAVVGHFWPSNPMVDAANSIAPPTGLQPMAVPPDPPAPAERPARHHAR